MAFAGAGAVAAAVLSATRLAREYGATRYVRQRADSDSNIYQAAQFADDVARSPIAHAGVAATAVAGAFQQLTTPRRPTSESRTYSEITPDRRKRRRIIPNRTIVYRIRPRATYQRRKWRRGTAKRFRGRGRAV